tara:strand:- start:191 stop:370 length:180 start_codon:yes stop_codon:yes gene_type:complete
MKLEATSSGTWPNGVHWTTGEVREIDVEKGVELPTFLVEVKVKTKKAKKADEPSPDSAG